MSSLGTFIRSYSNIYDCVVSFVTQNGKDRGWNLAGVTERLAKQGDEIVAMVSTNQMNKLVMW